MHVAAYFAPRLCRSARTSGCSEAKLSGVLLWDALFFALTRERIGVQKLGYLVLKAQHTSRIDVQRRTLQKKKLDNILALHLACRAQGSFVAIGEIEEKRLFRQHLLDFGQIPPCAAYTNSLMSFLFVTSVSLTR